MKIDWHKLPYDHKGKWTKKYQSIMNPADKVTWPQLVAEMVIYWRTKYWKKYSEVKVGAEWSVPIQRDVRSICEQAYAICNYFPHPDDEPLIVPAVKNFIRRSRVTHIGQFRKVRTKTSDGGRVVDNITQDEKDVVKGIQVELDAMVAQRDVFLQHAKTNVSVAPRSDEVSFRFSGGKHKRTNIDKLIELEKNIKAEPSPTEIK